MFGKKVGQYLSFQRLFLVAIVVVFVVRLALSLAGTPNATARWVSVTAVLLLGTLYYGVAVHTRGFGSYKQLYPLSLFQSLLGEGLVALGVALAIVTGQDNIYTAPEYSGGGDGKNWLHVFAHVVVAAVILPLVSWGISSLVLLVTKKVAPKAA
jgi:phosphate/sulfate permease